MAGSLAYRLGDPDRHPLTMPLSGADFVGGLQGCGATMLALYARRRTHRGQEVDVSTMECLSVNINSLMRVVAAAFDIGEDTKRIGYHGGSYPWVILPCKDGFVCILIGTARHWRRYLKMMGDPPWAREQPVVDFDQDYLASHADELDALQISWLVTRTRAELMELFAQHKIPCQPVQPFDEVVDSDQLKQREYFTEVEHPVMGRATVPGLPFRLPQSPYAVSRPAPLLGEHNEEIFCERAGLSRRDLALLKEEKVV
jgi:crotonobetainyl-CoA:carnitine CoA-transferase CaiB-like acyl-CoA transferase